MMITDSQDEPPVETATPGEAGAAPSRPEPGVVDAAKDAAPIASEASLAPEATLEPEPTPAAEPVVAAFVPATVDGDAPVFKRRGRKPAAPKPIAKGEKFETAVIAATEEKARPVAAPAKPVKPKKIKPLKVAKQAPLRTIANFIAKKRVAVAPAVPVKSKEVTKMSIETKVKQDINAFVTDVKSKAKVAYDKGGAVAGQFGDIVKSNADTVVASGKTLGLGLKQIGEGSIADSRQAVETFADDLKEIVAVKSPSDLLRLQGQIAARNLDTAFALATKNGEAFKALAASVFAPLSARAKANVEAVRKAA